MTRQRRVGTIYFFIIIATLLLRISTALDVYSLIGMDGSVYFTLVVQLLIFGLIPILSYYLFVLRKEGRPFKELFCDFGFKKVGAVDWLLILSLAILMIIVGSGASYAWQIGLQLIGYTHTSSPTDYSSVWVLVRELALVAVLPATFEEVTHRGLLYAGYRESAAKFAVVSALLFSLMHQNVVQTGYTFVHGVVMALCMYYTGSIFPGMVMHFLNNAYSVFSGYVAQNGGAFDFMNKISDWMTYTALGRIVSIAAFVAAAGLSVLILFILMKRHSKTQRTQMTATMRSKTFDAPFFATVAVGVAATAFSLVWGIMR